MAQENHSSTPLRREAKSVGARMQEPAKESIRRQVDKILSSAFFVNSERMSRFLRFTVDRALEGDAAQLKEYLLGIEVFDRRPDFDQRVDPIVRVEARRLRSKLKKYYETEGRQDPIAIEFPVGTYAPAFRNREQADPEASAPAPQTPRGHIAVLPFTNLSTDPESEYFSDGLTEQLIHRLTKVEGLLVVAWNSAARLKGAAYDVYSIGEQLKVGTVLMGSVRGAGQRLRITVQLIDTSNGYYLWSETYDRQMQDWFAIQDEISTAIVKTLELRLTDRPGLAAAGRPAYNLEAYNLYLKGRYHWYKRTGEGLRKGVRFFEEAISLDAGFALGHAGLADAYTLTAEYGLASPVDVMPIAKAAARKALELDPTLAEAHASLGLILSLYDWEWAEAGQHYRRAMSLNPGYATAHHWFAVDYLALLGRLDEAMVEIDIARQLDPLSPVLHEGKAFILMLAKRYDESSELYRELLDLDPNFYKGFTSMGRNYAQKGMYREGIDCLQKGRSLSGDVPSILGALGQTYGMAGQHENARGLLEELQALSREKYVPSTCFALVHLGLGEKERALDWLEEGSRRRELPLVSINMHPAYDDLRAEPRFAALVRKIGFPGARG